MDRTEILLLLKRELVSFFDELIELLPEESDLVIARILVDTSQVPITEIMEYIVTRLLPLKNLVKNRTDSFFLDNNILFESFERNKVNYFKKLWLEGDLGSENKAVIWDWFRAFLNLAERYQRVSSA